MAIGQKYSYGTDSPIAKDYIGNALDTVEQNQFKYRQEQRIAEAKKKADEEAKIKDISEWDGKFNPTIIGNQSIDDPIIGMAMTAKNRAGEITKKLYDPNLSTQQKVDLMTERNKLLQSFDVANQTPKLIQEKVKSLQEGIKQGKYNSRDVDFMQDLAKQIETGKFELNYDDRGVAKVKVYQTDESGKPIGVLKETSLGDLVNAFEPKLAFNYEAYKDASLKNVKPDEFGYQKGANVVTGTRLSEGNKVQAQTYADVILNDPNKLYEAQYLFKENDPEKLRVKLEEDFITSIPTGRKQSLDTGYLNFGLANRKAKKEEEENIPVIGTGTITSKEGVVEGTNYKIDKGSKTFAISKAQRKLGDGKIQSLKEVRVLPDGKLAFVTEETYETEGKTSSRLTPQGEKRIKDWLSKNPTKTEADIPKEGFYQYGDAENVNVKSTKPKIKVYDTGKNADDAEGLAIMLVNPETGEKFSGLNEATKFFKERAGGITSGGKKETPAERAQRIANGG